LLSRVFESLSREKPDNGPFAPPLAPSRIVAPIRTPDMKQGRVRQRRAAALIARQGDPEGVSAQRE